jgi:hypothetical protein
MDYKAETRKLMERVIQLRMELSYSITTYHALRMDVVRSVKKTF